MTKDIKEGGLVGRYKYPGVADGIRQAQEERDARGHVPRKRDKMPQLPLEKDCLEDALIRGDTVRINHFLALSSSKDAKSGEAGEGVNVSAESKGTKVDAPGSASTTHASYSKKASKKADIEPRPQVQPEKPQPTYTQPPLEEPEKTSPELQEE